MPREDEDRDWGDVSKPKNTKSGQQTTGGEAGTESPSEPQKEQGLPTPVRQCLLWLISLGLWYFVKAALAN